MKNNELEKLNINLGLQILRFVLCFWIVIIHCSKIKSCHDKYFHRGFHVPTFIKILYRFQRLLIPYILWPIIVLLVNNFLLSVFSIGQFNVILNINDIFIQFLIGLRFHPIFYFQFNLIFLSLLFTIIPFIFKSNFLTMHIYLGLISFFIHFSNINYNFFINYKREFQISLGTLVELMPIAVAGSVLCSLNILLKIKNFSFHFKLILICIIYFLFEYDIFIYQKGFFYHKVLLNILASQILFLFFGSLSFEKISNFKIIISIIINISKYTGGIYYIHLIFRDYFRKYSFFFAKGSYSVSVIIYIICYIFCFIGIKIFKNSKLKYLFI